MIKFSEIQVIGLFGHYNVTLPINDNKIIIVGPNGIGKSTVLNAFYYFISAQWEKLSEIQFESIRIRAGRRVFAVKRRWLLDMKFHFSRSQLERTSQMAPRGSVLRVLSRLTLRNRRILSAPRVSVPVMRAIADEIEVPVSMIRELSILLRKEAGKFNENKRTEIQKIESFLENNLEGRTLYLPTYRRIEKDLNSIFPELEERINRAFLPQRLREHSNRSDLHIELVKFGMEDVQTMLDDKMTDLRNLALSEIRSLSTRYLRDVIRNTISTENLERVRDFNEIDLERMFAGVDKSIFSATDKSKIYGVVEKIKVKSDDDIKGNERYIAHYVSSLIDIWENMDAREEPVVKFVEICNDYFYGKEFEFNKTGYSFSMKYKNDGSPAVMEDLSSGEKQMASLFAHMAFSRDKWNYVIIDEPELSLSVNWQVKFLQDILNFRSCAFVGAVTHSPFIFDNEFDPYVVDMHSCMSK